MPPRQSRRGRRLRPGNVDAVAGTSPARTPAETDGGRAANVSRAVKVGARTIRDALVRPGPDPTYADGDDASWMAIDWASMTRTVVLDDCHLNVVDTGGEDKPVLVLLHGLANRWQHWLLTIPAFMATHRCIAPDLPGFGGSTLPHGRITIRDYARQVDELCRALGANRVAVVGSSMGGFVGAELALSFPTRVEKLVLVSAAGLSIEHVRRAPLLAFGRIVSLLGSRVVTGYDLLIGHPRLRRAALGLGVRYPQRLSLALTRELIQGFGTPGFFHALDALTSYSFRERLPEITVPTLIVWGENDFLVPVKDAAEFERLIGGASRRVIFDDTGHSPMLERPTRFNEVVAHFLAGEPQPNAQVPGVRHSRDGRFAPNH
jgi:pimeloyl-ACP methyl ester carboxylesterase